MYNAFGLRGLAFPLTSRYSSSQIPSYIGLGRRERDERGLMPIVLYTWLTMLMQKRDRSHNVIIFDRDMHTKANLAAFHDPPQVCALQLIKSKRLDWARSYHHEVMQRVQAGVYQTGLAQCELWIQFGMPLWVEDESMPIWKCQLQRKQANRPMQKSQTRTSRILRTTTMPRCCHNLMSGLLGSQRRFGRSTLVMQMKMSRRRVKRRSPKKPKTKAAAELKQTTLTQPQGVKTTLSFPDPGTAVGSTARSKMSAAGLKKKKKPST